MEAVRLKGTNGRDNGKGKVEESYINLLSGLFRLNFLLSSTMKLYNSSFIFSSEDCNRILTPSLPRISSSFHTHVMMPKVMVPELKSEMALCNSICVEGIVAPP